MPDGRTHWRTLTFPPRPLCWKPEECADGALVPAIITSKDGAWARIEGSLKDCDDAVFAPTVCGMTDTDDAGVFAIMRGSGNEISLFTQALYVLDKHRFITCNEGVSIMRRK